MTPEGYSKIRQALIEETGVADVYPHPTEGEDVRYLKIKVARDNRSAVRALNVLEKAGLMYSEGRHSPGEVNDPALHPLSVSDYSITLEDKNYRP